MILHASESGNNAFANSEGQLIIWVSIPDSQDEDKRLEISFTPENSPMWAVDTVSLSDAALQRYIEDEMAGWSIDRCQLDINIRKRAGVPHVADADDIVEDIVEDIVAKAEKYEFDPTQTDGMAQDAIHDSASALSEPLSGYTVTPYIMDEAMKALYAHPAFNS